VQLSPSTQRTPQRLKEPVATGAAARRGTWCWAFSALLGCLVMAGLCGSSPAAAQVVDREYTLKAVYLYKIASYVRWPEEVFAGPDSPFVIGVLGPDPLGPALREIAKTTEVGKRKVEIRNYKNYKQVKQIRDCQLLFISRGVDGQAQRAALKQLAGKNMLFVGESEGFLEQGGVVDFVIQENKIHLFISKSAYEREGLEISAKLLRVATVLK
jgi:hypothetical protein